MEFKKSLYVNYILMLLIMPLGFLIKSFYSRTLTTEEFGLFYSIISIFSLLYVIISFGLTDAITYNFSKYVVKDNLNKVQSMVNTIFTFYTGIFMIFIGIFYFIFDELAIYFFKVESAKLLLLILSIYFIFDFLTTIYHSIFLSFEKNHISQILGILKLTNVLFVSILLFYINEFNFINKIAIIWSITSLLIFLIYLITARFKLSLKLNFEFNWVEFKKYLNYSKYVIFFQLGMVIISQTDILMITYFLGLSNVAYYVNALTIISMVFLISTPISNLFFPKIAKLKELNNINVIRTIISKVYIFLLTIFLPIIVLFYYFSEYIISLLFSEKYLDSVFLTQIFCFFIIFKVLFVFNFKFLKGLGLIEYIVKVVIFIAFFNLVFNLLIINIYYSFGVVLVSGISWFLMLFFTFVKLDEELNGIFTNFDFIKIIKIFIFNILFLFLEYFIFIFNFNIFYLVFFTAINLFIYLSLILIFDIYSKNQIYSLFKI